MSWRGVDPAKPHAWEPRRYGTREACKWCGAVRNDPIHTNRQKRRPFGQAIVELAIATPLLLLLLTGILAVGWITLDLNLLNHAAQEAAVAGAGNPGDACGLAEATARAVYPFELDGVKCEVRGQFIEVRLLHSLPIHHISPVWSTELGLDARAEAVIR